MSANPYRHALDGLELPDPVGAFFEFCRAREAVREARAKGAAPPWTDDPILQRGRFLNVFREDDRGTRSVLRFLERVDGDLASLIHAAFFARWCNAPDTLDRIEPSALSDPKALRDRLERLADQPWCNVTAYPVEPVRWEGLLRSRLDTATSVFATLRNRLEERILAANGSVIRATDGVNELLGMSNDFPIFMAVIDLAWFRPDVIAPGSPVPTGIGAAPFLDRLQAALGAEDHAEVCARIIALQPTHWPDARRELHPIDVEYLACECRKYFSYRNGTKSFEGKNVFVQGERPRLVHDSAAPGARTENTRIQVVAGGPCSGKTTLLRALEREGYRVERETAEEQLEAALARGLTAEEARADPIAWQREMLDRDYARFASLPTDEVVFTDTSFIEDLVFSERAGLQIGPNTEAWIRAKRYERVFFLEPLVEYESTKVRMESAEVAAELSRQVRDRYNAYGYELTAVPAVSVEERLALILRYLR